MILFSFLHTDEAEKDFTYGGLYAGFYPGYNQARGLITTWGKRTGGFGSLKNIGLSLSLAMSYGDFLESGIYLGAEFEVGSLTMDRKGIVKGQPALPDMIENYGLFA
ncbi:hypothetical protein CHU95_09130 [Niveispirillum lacus]|uniref:Uncharacterized protein n=1 Tax=Niveispirillum lacus TaxID=1981099 RepID=A0A255Z1R0_9PROT|nr:hypothetical protein [Niveispirillum lacus]OYQ35359.1 hypothetical protein CHU95_09130 [Niveispirillum lacus]